MKKQRQSQKIAIICNQYTALFELGCAVELFALDRPDIENWYQTDVVSLSGETVKSTANVLLSVKSVRSLKHYDTVVIPNWNVDETIIPENLKRQLMAFHNQGKRIFSLCSGAFLLAQLGILDGQDATTHWQYADSFRKRFPRVNYIEDVLYVYQGNIGTSAGSAAAIDMGIEIIRRDYGYKIANKVARRLVLPAHRSGNQSQFIESTVLVKPEKFASSIDWALERINDSISVNDLAEQANMTRRTYDRKFRTSFNLSPKEWLIKQRLELAKQLLEESTQSIEVVAENAGFRDATNLRHHFRKHLKISPLKYREYFRNNLMDQS